jgi:hypothetical protein
MSTWSRRAARTWPSTRRSPRRSGSSSTAHPGPRSRRRSTSSRLVDPTLALHVLLAVIFTSHMRNVPSRHSTGSVADRTGIVIVSDLLLSTHGAKSVLGDVLEPGAPSGRALAATVAGSHKLRGLLRHLRAEARIRGLRIPRAQLGLAPMSGNREVSATGGERVASARALGNRSRESRSVMWTPGSLSGGEALAFGSLAATPS